MTKQTDISQAEFKGRVIAKLESIENKMSEFLRSFKDRKNEVNIKLEKLEDTDNQQERKILWISYMVLLFFLLWLLGVREGVAELVVRGLGF